MLLNKNRMEVPSTTISTTTLATGSTMFKYIVKEKHKKVIVISDSDEEQEDDEEKKNENNQDVIEQTIQHTSKKRKRSTSQTVHGNVHDPISLDDSDQDEFFGVETTIMDKEEQGKVVDNLLLSETRKLLVSDPITTTLVSLEQTDNSASTSNPVIQDQLDSNMAETDLFYEFGSDLELNLSNTNTLSPLSEYTAMSDFEVPLVKREGTMEVLDSNLQDQIKAAPTTVNTIQSDDNSLLLRKIELYIQSVTDISMIPTEARVSRRSTRHIDTHDTPLEVINPYVPNRVWYNSTWEDWAQLDVGDVLHCPFTEEEAQVLEIQVAKQNIKRSKFGRDLVDFWQYASTFLPGRSPLDCRCFWQDYTEGSYRLYNKTIMIARQKTELKNNSRHQMVLKRSCGGVMNYNSMRMVHLANMTRESIISDGSGDAITLALFSDAVNGIRVAVGSLCDENMQYNMPGNLRLWSSDSKNCLSLRGHKTPNEENGQEIWRTVTDVKMSKDQSLIYSASHDGCANIWKASNGKLVSTLQYHCKPINQMAVNYSAMDKNILATCSNDGTATIWDVSANGKTGSGTICELDTRFYLDPRVDCIEFGHHASENSLFLGVNNKDIDHPGYVEVFDARRGQSKLRFDTMKGCVSALAVSSSGQFIVSGNYNRYDNMSGDRYLHLHDMRSPKTATKFYSGHPDVNIVAISPCERYAASGNADKEKGEVLVFDVRSSRKPLHTLAHDQTLVDQSLIAPDSSIGIGGLYWMSDSRTIFTGGGDSAVKVWSIEGATRLLKTYPTANCVTALNVHEESMTIAAGVAGAQGIVHVWQP